jgi:predicted DNA-binding transcriptional regulator YafY
MARKKAGPPPAALTAQRAARLYKLLTLLGEGPQTRRLLLNRLKLDVRGFYRDLETLRGFGIEVAPGFDTRYTLAGSVDDALARLPFPDPGLNVRDALQLANGTSPAHRRLRQRVTAFIQGNGTAHKPR